LPSEWSAQSSPPRCCDELHRYYTGPTNQDSDSDGVSDGDEVLRDHTDPNFNPGKDPDGDGLETPEELDNHLDPQNPDSDRDGLLDGEEMRTYQTGPLNQDSDNDDISDGDEVKRYHTNPLVANPLPAQTPPHAQAPKTKDTDGDGLSDDDETKTYRTNPNRKDTDRDGRDDGVEVKNGTNPRVPINLAANDAAAVAAAGAAGSIPGRTARAIVGCNRLQPVMASWIRRSANDNDRR
jgi:hypothetical protein